MTVAIAGSYVPVRRSSIRWSRPERRKAPKLEDLHTSHLTGSSGTGARRSGLPLDAAVDSPSSVLNVFLTGSDVAPFPPYDLRPRVIVGRQKPRCYKGGMTITSASMTTITDADLLTAVARAAAQERGATANLIAMLAELDARRLYLGEGCSSLFTYCTQVLRLSEHAAYGRIGAARRARLFPIVLDLLTEGTINLTTIGLLAPCLTEDNVEDLLAAARHKSKREIERLVSSMRPLPPVPSTLRKLPTPAASRPKGDQSAQSVERRWWRRAIVRDVTRRVCSSSPRPATVTSLAPERYKLPDHDVPRDARQTAPRAGSSAARDPQRRPSGNRRPGAHSARRGPREDSAGGDEAAPIAATSRVPSALRTGRRQARGLGTRPRAVRVRRRKGRCTERGWLELHHLRAVLRRRFDNP